MLRALRLPALLACLAFPALAQAPAPASRPATSTATRPVTAPAAAAKRIDVNAASEAELATLPGIGPATAKAIVAGRPWDDLGDLLKKKVMAYGVYDRNKDHFALANINTSSAADMVKTLPGIGEKTAPKIVDGRPYATPEELVGKKVLTQGQFDRIKGVVTY